MDPRTLYTKDTQVWIPDDELVWIGGELLSDASEKILEVLLEDGREVSIEISSDIRSFPPLRNPEILVGANDLTTLSYLHEPAVLYNLQERFLNFQAIYTYCGIVLVALNPYEELPLYGPDIIAAYSGRPMGEMDPHIFAIAEDAFRKMTEREENQSIIVSGESGAGKTVSAKFAMRYFANVGGSLTETAIEKKVLASNPIMEAIGNAKTIRNDNSSRFGKYIEIGFSPTYHIVGANMRTYLLEKSRVVFQAQDERNYHIFYQMCASYQLPELKELNLGPPEDFYYTNQGENAYVDNVDDAETFRETREAMTLLGIHNESQRMIFRVLAGILHLGNVQIERHSKKEDESEIAKGDFSIHVVAELLGIDRGQLQKWLCNRKIVATGEVYVKPLNATEANIGRDALAKHVYAHIFKWFVEHINSAMATTAKTKQFIGVLDIYGFETFEVNSFEQFCINYANEKLQQQFNMHVFKLEQEEYIREKITWSFIDFYDNQPCIDLIEAKMGILDLLDEECRMPKGSDDSWARKLYKQHLGKVKHFMKPRMSEAAFIVRHYADDVIYDCDSFVSKNRDTINEEHLSLLRASQFEMVAELFRTDNTSTMFVPRKRTSSRVGAQAPKGKKTVGSEFRDSLSRLMQTLNATSPHYIRCIKPNDFKEVFEFDPKRSIQQLRACGVLETIRISAAGYPSRWTYEEFYDRYRMIIPSELVDRVNYKDTCRYILEKYIQDPDKFQLGLTKIFFRAGQVAYLEKMRADTLKKSCVIIQKCVRGWLWRTKYQTMKKSAVLIQAWVKGHQARRLVTRMRRTKASITLQKYWRGRANRLSYLRLRSAVITIQCYARGAKARKLRMKLLYEQKALVIQRCWRGYNGRRFYRKRMKAIVLLQSCVRRMYARRELKKLKIEARSVDHLKKLNKGMENKIIELQQKFTVELNEKKFLKTKVQDLEVKEKELVELKEIKPEYEKAKTKIVGLDKELEQLRQRINELLKEKDQAKIELDAEKEERKEEITGLKGEITLLRTALEDSKKRNKEIQIQQEEAIKLELDEQRNQLLSEFSSERTAHQKMVKEYARLEQRYSNLEDELKLEISSPDKIAREKRKQIAAENSDVNDVVFAEEEEIRNLKIELADNQRERDMLSTELERVKTEFKKEMRLPLRSMNVTNFNSNDEPNIDDLMAEKSRLIDENEQLIKTNIQMSRLQQLVWEENDNMPDDVNGEIVVSKLMEKLETTEKEKEELTKRLSNGKLTVVDRPYGDPKHAATSPMKDFNNTVAWPVETESLKKANAAMKKELDNMKIEREKFKRDLLRIQDMKVPEVAQHAIIETSAQLEMSRLTQENTDLREKVELLEKQAKELKTNGVTSPPTTRAGRKGSQLSPGSGQMRRRANTMDVKFSKELNAGKLVMTYAGLFRKSSSQDAVSPDESPRDETPKPTTKRPKGVLEFKSDKEAELIGALVNQLEPISVEKEVPGLPAHLIFMAIRYVDALNDERGLQSLLANAITAIRKTVKHGQGNMELQAFWLTNTCRLLYDMKQYSGDKTFQTHNTTEQNNQSLQNFDLTEYRQVLTDVAVHIYQELLKTIQEKISPLIVPGLLEYESIPGVLSSKPFGRGAKSRGKSITRETEDIITVKDITNKLSAILAVLNAHCVDMVVIKQIFTQINYYICATMLNNLLLRKDMCHWSRGMQIRFNLTQLEEWCRTNQLDSVEITKHLDPIKEATQLLQVNKKSLDDVDSILSVCSTLNPLQVQKILTMYTPANEYEPRVPSKVIRAVVAKATKQSPDPSSLMMNIQFSSPVNFPFTPSAVEFEKIKIPNVLKLRNVKVI
eukprot:gene4645-5253_t